MTSPPPVRVVTLPRAALSRFAPLFQRGVAVPVAGGRSVHRFLTEDLGLDEEYVRARITTVFLDGDVVDSLDDARLRAGSVLALSAAMPGLVGATMRRSGPYAAMRAAITRRGGEGSAAAAPAAVVARVKLFNLLLEELGPVLLERGVLLDAAEEAEVLGAAARASPGAAASEVRVLFD